MGVEVVGGSMGKTVPAVQAVVVLVMVVSVGGSDISATNVSRKPEAGHPG